MISAVTAAAKSKTAAHVEINAATAIHDPHTKRNRPLLRNQSRVHRGSGQVDWYVLKYLPDLMPGRPYRAEKPRRVQRKGRIRGDNQRIA